MAGWTIRDATLAADMEREARLARAIERKRIADRYRHIKPEPPAPPTSNEEPGSADAPATGRKTVIEDLDIANAYILRMEEGIVRIAQWLGIPGDWLDNEGEEPQDIVLACLKGERERFVPPQPGHVIDDEDTASDAGADKERG